MAAILIHSCLLQMLATCIYVYVQSSYRYITLSQPCVNGVALNMDLLMRSFKPQPSIQIRYSSIARHHKHNSQDLSLSQSLYRISFASQPPYILIWKIIHIRYAVVIDNPVPFVIPGSASGQPQQYMCLMCVNPRISSGSLCKCYHIILVVLHMPGGRLMERG